MNLQSPLYDRVRIPVRQSSRVIAERLCREAGFEPEVVRRGALGGKGATPGVYELRCQIACAIADAGYEMCGAGGWLEDISPLTLRRYAVAGRQMLQEGV